MHVFLQRTLKCVWCALADILCAGALEYSNKEVKDVMTPIEKVFMLEASTKLTFDTMLDIYKSGYTRIPVYDGTVSKDRVISVLYVKDLILVDPDDEIEVQTVVSFRCAPWLQSGAAVHISLRQPPTLYCPDKVH